jgi:hypothetical protein
MFVRDMLTRAHGCFQDRRLGRVGGDAGGEELRACGLCAEGRISGKDCREGRISRKEGRKDCKDGGIVRKEGFKEGRILRTAGL